MFALLHEMKVIEMMEEKDRDPLLEESSQNEDDIACEGTSDKDKANDWEGPPRPDLFDPESPEIPEEPLPEGADFQVYYRLTAEDSKRAFASYQRRKVMPRYYVYTAILGVIAICYGIDIFRSSDRNFAIFMIVICLAVILSLWTNVLTVRKKLYTALDLASDDPFRAVVYPDKLSIQLRREVNGSVNDPTFISPAFDKLWVIPDTELFVLVYEKRNLFVIPHKAMTQKEQEALDVLLAQAKGGKKRNFQKTGQSDINQG